MTQLVDLGVTLVGHQKKIINSIQVKNPTFFLLQELSALFKETKSVSLSDLSLIKGHVRFTTIPLINDFVDILVFKAGN